LRREQIFARDDFQCVYCGERFEPGALTVDHVQPRMRGGDRSGGNLVTACEACNARKGSLRLADFLRDDPAAQQHFFTLAAAHVWPRILRSVREELEREAPKGAGRDR
jgi:5-methylcytosine-specific restriction endonuclease McrA